MGIEYSSTSINNKSRTKEKMEIEDGGSKNAKGDASKR